MPTSIRAGSPADGAANDEQEAGKPPSLPPPFSLPSSLGEPVGTNSTVSTGGSEERWYGSDTPSTEFWDARSRRTISSAVSVASYGAETAPAAEDKQQSQPGQQQARMLASSERGRVVRTSTYSVRPQAAPLSPSMLRRTATSTRPVVGPSIDLHPRTAKVEAGGGVIRKLTRILGLSGKPAQPQPIVGVAVDIQLLRELKPQIPSWAPQEPLIFMGEWCFECTSVLGHLNGFSHIPSCRSRHSLPFFPCRPLHRIHTV